MRPAHVIEILTPKRFALNGLWFGSPKPQRAIVHVHGLFSSAFSMAGVIEHLADTDTAVITFNNRGHDTISDAKQVVSKTKRKYLRAGAAHEVFTDCVDDIQGAIDFVRKAGVKDIFLAGHSTGCQKSMYWAYKGGKGVKGIILYAPLSDFAGDAKKSGLKKATKIARELVKNGKKHQLLPTDAWWHYVDAQRFLSLYTPDSLEQSIFPYFDAARVPRIFRSVRLPILALFAGDDEYSERPAAKLASWFGENAGSDRFDAVIIPKVGHSFKGSEADVADVVHKWISR